MADFTNNSEGEAEEVNIIREKELNGHCDSVFDILYFPSQGILVSCSDRTIRYWDVNNSKNVHTFEFIPATPNEMVMWNDCVFLTSFERGIICSYSVEKPFQQLKVFNTGSAYHGRDDYMDSEEFRLAICRTMKVKGEDKFISINRFHDFLVFDYNENEIVRNMKSYKVGYTSKLVWSKTHEGCFYYLTDYQDQYKIRLIHYETENVEKVYDDHDQLEDIELTKNQIGEELIIGCGHNYDSVKDKEIHGIFIYHSDTSQLIHFFELSSGEPNRLLLLCGGNIILPSRFTFRLFKQRKGKERCLIQFARFNNINKENDMRCQVSPKRPPSIDFMFPFECIYNIAFLGLADGRTCARLAICGSDQTIRIVKVENLHLEDPKKEQAQNDLDERVSSIHGLVGSNKRILEIIINNGVQKKRTILVIMKCIL